jgi:hypothetical protein
MIGVREYGIVDVVDGLIIVSLKDDDYTPYHYFQS